MIAQGGGGNIYFGAIVNTEVRSKFAFCADSVAIKTLNPVPEIGAETSLDMFHQEVAVMK